MKTIEIYTTLMPRQLFTLFFALEYLDTEPTSVKLVRSQNLALDQ